MGIVLEPITGGKRATKKNKPIISDTSPFPDKEKTLDKRKTIF